MNRPLLTLVSGSLLGCWSGSVLSAVSTAAVSIPAQAVSQAVTSHKLSAGFDFSALGQLLAGLLLVLVVFLGLAWLVKRSGMAGGFSSQGLKVLSSLPLSSRERLVLIQAGSKQLLLGVAPGRVNLLESFDQPLVEIPKASPPPFAHWLQRAMQKSPGTHNDKGGVAGE